MERPPWVALSFIQIRTFQGNRLPGIRPNLWGLIFRISSSLICSLNLGFYLNRISRDPINILSSSPLLSISVGCVLHPQLGVPARFSWGSIRVTASSRDSVDAARSPAPSAAGLSFSNSCPQWRQKLTPSRFSFPHEITLIHLAWS